jgi:hypothetical protein
MTASLRALLEGVIDYAGLFPPAQLPLEEAFRNYVQYRREPESWMLGRFIIQVERLPELHPLMKSVQTTTPPITFSVLGQGGRSGREFAEAFQRDLTAIVRFDDLFKRGPDIDALETVKSLEIRVSSSVLSDAIGKSVAGGLAALEELNLQAFVETPSTDWRASTTELLKVVTCPAPGQEHPISLGLKLRCGGLEAAAFPSPEQLAFVITACRDALVPLKFTAGLHHPIRHYNDGVKTKMHGFLNVFGAGVLAHRHHLNEAQVRQIIEDEDPANFRFDDECVRWKDHAATVGETRLARQLAVTSFGSCSFDEPRDDLRKLGLL